MRAFAVRLNVVPSAKVMPTAAGPRLDDVAAVNGIAHLGLTDASGNRDIRLNDHGVRMLDGDRTRRGYHPSNRSRFEAPR